MQRTTIIEQLKIYIGRTILEGKDIGLDETTPLLEWGIINSLEMVKLLSFIREQFAVDITPDKLIPDYFANLATLADLVLNITLV
jgi:acyl carrier protein